MKCDTCKKKEVETCECCGGPIKPKVAPTSIPQEHDDFGDHVKQFRDRNGRNPRGEEWAMFL